MRTSIALIAGLGLALGSATAAFAGDDTMKPGASGASGAATGAAAVSAPAPLLGEVTDKQGDTLTIRRADGERSQVRTTDSTKFRGQTGELDIDDIETGDQVRVTSMDSAEGRVASDIQVVASGTGDSGIRDRSGSDDDDVRDPRSMSPGENPIQGTPDHNPDRATDDSATR